MAQVAIFKQIFDKVRNNLNYHWFYSELKRHNVSHYIYYLIAVTLFIADPTNRFHAQSHDES